MTSVRVALAGDTMLGRKVGDAIATDGIGGILSDEVIGLTREADLFLLNLECCISAGGEPWPDPAKPFFFRGPPQAADLLVRMGVDCVSLANNHALDFGPEALADTLELLGERDISVVGAGLNEAEARQPAVLEAGDATLGVVGVTDHPTDFAAGPDRPGVAFADLRRGFPAWLANQIGTLEADIVLGFPHWGPNMVPAPVPHVRRAAAEFMEAGTTLVAGHSAHVFHGVGEGILFDLGDFLDDYAVDPRLRNDLGLLFFATLAPEGLLGLEAVPIALDFCHTRVADDQESTWIVGRLEEACSEFDTDVRWTGDRCIIEPG